MTKKRLANLFRNVTALLLSFVLFSVSAMFIIAKTPGKVIGEISVSGDMTNGNSGFVLLNGERVKGGRTFVSGGMLKTEGDGAFATIGGVGSIKLEPNSRLDLNFTENSISGTLAAGKIDVVTSEGVEIKISTPDGVITNQEAGASSFSVDLRSSLTKGDVQSGKIVINNGNGAVPLGANQDDDDDKGMGIWKPVLVFSAIVGVAVVALWLANRDNVESPSR